MNIEQRQMRMMLLEAIHENGGKMTFTNEQFSDEAFRLLATLEAASIIEEMPAPDVPSEHTYRLKRRGVGSE